MGIALALRGLGKDWGARTAVAALDLEVRTGECFGQPGDVLVVLQARLR